MVGGLAPVNDRRDTNETAASFDTLGMRLKRHDRVATPGLFDPRVSRKEGAQEAGETR
jgi:hypothetical protein